MNTFTIEQALSYATDTDVFVTGANVIDELPEILTKHFGIKANGGRIAVIGDQNTMKAAGNNVVEICAKANIESDTFVFPSEPLLHADYDRSVEVRTWLLERDVIPVAVGSGTVNDIVKVAAYEYGRPYLVVATAASVDGYTSHGAAMSRDGFKNTIPCAAPKAVVADTDVICTAPAAMAAAGYADLVAKVPAGADWLIADILGAEAIDEISWKMVQDDLKSWIANPERVKAEDPKALGRVMEGLTFTGFAMQYSKKSRPASGSEHLISHVWEMQNLEKDGAPVSHGFKVGLGTLMSTAMMEFMFERGVTQADMQNRRSQWPSWEDRNNELSSVYAGTPMFGQIVDESRAKYLDLDKLAIRQAQILESWDEMARAVSHQLIPIKSMRDMLVQADCPVTLSQIGVDTKRAYDAVFSAQMIRNRYGIIDLAYETGLLKECAEHAVEAVC